MTVPLPFPTKGLWAEFLGICILYGMVKVDVTARLAAYFNFVHEHAPTLPPTMMSLING